MEFGRLPGGQILEHINLKLPEDPELNKKVLRGTPVKKVAGYVGCEKWGRKEWVGKLFPLKTKEKDYLEYFAKQYNCIELNATHYQVYTEETFNKWKEKVGNNDFIFCPKAYKGITHFGSLRGKEFITKQFLDNLIFLRPNLGPIFIQVSESFAPKRKDELYDYLKSLPANDFQFFLEIRHPEWFTNKQAWQELIETLTKLNIGLIITDTAGRRDVVHMQLTIPKAMIRFVADDINPINIGRVDKWAERLKYWIDNGLKEFYFFVHVHNDAMAPEFTIEVIERFNRTLGMEIKKPVLVEKQRGLFG